MLSEQQIQLGNIHTDTIRNGSIGDQVVLTATLNFDQVKATSVSSRVMGRVEKLYYKNLGDYVKKGAAIIRFVQRRIEQCQTGISAGSGTKENICN